MARQRATSNASTNSSHGARDQELGSMYDYLAKVILLGPSGCGKSCVLHRFVKDEWRVLSSQTIGVEFASKIVRVGTGSRRKRIKLQLWDTAGTERFRSVSRSYYRGAAGAVLVYDISSLNSFNSLPTFLNDARALASPNLTVVLAGNKCDLSEEYESTSAHNAPPMNSLSSKASTWTLDSQSSVTTAGTPRTPTQSRPGTTSTVMATPGLGSQNTVTTALHGREVPHDHAQAWATSRQIPYSIECSAFTGENVEELFNRLALNILTKIELGEIDPDDPASGIQYGDSSGWWAEDGGSVKSGYSGLDGLRSRRGGRRRAGGGNLSEWEEVFRIGGRRRRGCC